MLEDSNGGGANVAGTTGRASRVVGGAKNVASGVGTIGDATKASGMISVNISACCAYGGCSSCGDSGGAGIFGALGGAT